MVVTIVGCSNSSKDDNKNMIDTTKVVAEDGDRVCIDFVGYLDGEEFEGGSANDYYLVLGSNTFIDNFEEQIVSHKVGDTFDVNVTFPENYGKEALNGKDVVFKVTLHEVWRKLATDE